MGQSLRLTSREATPRLGPGPRGHVRSGAVGRQSEREVGQRLGLSLPRQFPRELLQKLRRTLEGQGLGHMVIHRGDAKARRRLRRVVASLRHGLIERDGAPKSCFLAPTNGVDVLDPRPHDDTVKRDEALLSTTKEGADLGRPAEPQRPGDRPAHIGQRRTRHDPCASIIRQTRQRRRRPGETLDLL